MGLGKHRQLAIGENVPQFRVKDVMGNVIDLADYDDNFVLLVFLRYSGCPWCNLTLHRLTLEYPMLSRNGCKVIAFMQSTPQNIKKNVYDRHETAPPFPIIADQSRKYYDMYHVETSLKAAAKSLGELPYWIKSVYGHGYQQADIDGDALLVPATFLVSPDEQKIVKAEYGSSFYDHRTFTEIYEPLIFK